MGNSLKQSYDDSVETTEVPNVKFNLLIVV